uniref:ATP-binding cassette transporter n=1 Tax=Kwoniella pini CBS 10737 TaxID=1296096 RepID=A0A1B9HUC0_9TREE|nr:ATP-binding cassette transporter [Kwoniella pini CBS 10737]OCF46864.1 ATP-binding cassette transporter [Kwoniella pini CBS 10737]
MNAEANFQAFSPLIISSIRTISSLSILILVFIVSLPPFKPIRRFFHSLLSDLVPLESLVPPEPPTERQRHEAIKRRPAIWKQIILSLISIAEIGVWTGITGWQIMGLAHRDGHKVTDILLSAGMIVVWLYFLLQFTIRPLYTPSYTTILILSILLVLSVLSLGNAWYLKTINNEFPSWATKTRNGLEIGDIAGISIILIVLFGLKITSPEVLSRLPEVSLDDDVTLYSWLSFNWVNEFIAFGASKELDPEDLPKLSLKQQTAIVFDRFNQLKTSSLLKQIFLANKLDLGSDAALTLLAVVFNYAGPYFLKKILDGIDNKSARAMSQAYIFAFLAFLASTLKALVDLLHLWHGRRAALRIKAELTAAIFDKALRRKDASGIVTTKEDEEKEAKEGGKAEKKSNADSGKVVNLMAGDTNRIGNTVSGGYFIYGAPFEIIVASVFLYNILGWSAFAGVVVLVVATPLNSFVSKRSIAITQDLLKARDKRIGVMNELIGAIQFIKFFAWIEQWKNRAAEARAKEMKQMVRSLINGIWFSLLWSLAPIFVTLVSFFCYIVIAKRELTVSVAFTAISLFSMLRMPLNVIPTFAVILLQAHVSVKRIEDFLAEDEVPDWVSSLKRSVDPKDASPNEIGFANASFRWNTGKQSEQNASASTEAAKKPKTIVEPPSPSQSTSTTAVDSSSSPQDDRNEDGEESFFTLTDLNVSFPVGKLTIITGPTGSGKTAILTALLGEMELLNGKSYLPKNTTQINSDGLRNSIAYAAQTPWLQQKSIKDNILFGEAFDEARYEMVLDACALNPDLDMLEDGDQTEIGAKGVAWTDQRSLHCSGGQKARVALARAVYSYTQHVLLDDPLAAVDSHTAKHLTDKCLNGSILKNRTIILVSHHVELLLPSSDYLVRILDGRIDAQGTPDELRSAGELDGLVALEEAEVTKSEAIVAKEEVEEEVEVVDSAEKKVKKKGPGKKLIQDEERAVGNVKWETYKLYIVAATYVTWVWTLLVLLLNQGLTVGERWWLKVWGEAYNTQFTSHTTLFAVFRPAIVDHAQHYHHTDLHQHVLHHTSSAMVSNMTVGATAIKGLRSYFPPAQTNPGFYLSVYTGIVLGAALFGVGSSAVGSWSSYRAAIHLHDRLLERVMRSTVRFFSVTPVGRIINRFSRDVETIDSSLNGALRTVIIYIASLIGAIVVVAAIVPWFLLPAAIISYLYYQYSIVYLRVGRSLRRLEATLKSPIFSGFAELLDGVISVRAFSVEARFMTQLCEQVDKTHQAYYYYWMMNRWLLIRFDVLGAISVFLTTLFALSGAVPAGSAGMAIVSAQSFVLACYWVSRFWGQLEMDFNSVERVQEYLSLPQEPPAVIPRNRPPAYWPSTNASTKDQFLSVRELEIKYAPDLPSVFKGSFDIRAGEKIGLIGRTGSGKSTLAMSLLRFAEPYGGSIWLDGIDITKIGVDDLRSRITYIPQDAVLFSGTVRENLDPFNEHTDEELLDALSRVNLGPADTPPSSRVPSRVPSSKRLAALAAEDAKRLASPAPSGSTGLGGKSIITLTTEVSAGGSNFSQGQRQLVAMARALLRKSNLIIMDEATASVDFATDEAIQAAIRSEFKSSTLLTIAHRLSSVIDYDRLLVLSDGRVAEFDTPINLLRKDDSLFKSLCEKSGKYKDLYKAAEKKEKDDGEKDD